MFRSFTSGGVLSVILLGLLLVPKIDFAETGQKCPCEFYQDYIYPIRRAFMNLQHRLDLPDEDGFFKYRLFGGVLFHLTSFKIYFKAYIEKFGPTERRSQILDKMTEAESLLETAQKKVRETAVEAWHYARYLTCEDVRGIDKIIDKTLGDLGEALRLASKARQIGREILTLLSEERGLWGRDTEDENLYESRQYFNRAMISLHEGIAWLSAAIKQFNDEIIVPPVCDEGSGS